MSKCAIHDEEHVKQDVGRGKWIPVCAMCERERADRLRQMFATPAPGPLSLPPYTGPKMHG